jgi:molybdopterin-guanine dinucleotide biosynthesis protein A
MTKTASGISAVSAVILTGGESRRLGRDKSQLKLGQQTLLARSIETMAALTDDVIVVTRKPRRPGRLPARLVSDVITGRGALSGLHAGLQAARHEYVLVIACDMPFLNSRLLRYMVVIAPGYDAIVPHWQGEVEPLHAVYAQACLPAIETLLHSGGGRLVEFYPQVNVRYLEHSEITLFDPQGLSFFNVNTPEDWERAQALEASRS